MGYLLCWGGMVGDSCPEGNLYDEVDISTEPTECREELLWDILDYGTYSLIVDGEDEFGAVLWGVECTGLLVDSYEPYSNEFICQVFMTFTP